MSDLPVDIMRLSADTIRTLTMDAVQKANIGHPGMPMGTADLSVVLWSQFLKHDPTAPEWPDRDRFVLSAGHGSMLIYSLLHLTGYDLPLDELKQFRQWDSKTPGHPEYGHTEGVEVTTGPLGQGISTAVGMALAEAHLAARYNRPNHTLIDHNTYVIASDGDLMEGVSHEASALAGHLKLHKLTVLYDDNSITIDGTTALSMSEEVLKRYDAYGWHTQRIDGHDMEAVSAALAAAQAADKPSIIACRTHIGYGSPNKQDTSSAHGSPLGDEEIALTKQALGWDYPEPFTVPDEVYAFMRDSVVTGQTAHQEWGTKLEAYQEAFPDEAAELIGALHGELPADWQDSLPTFEVGTKLATRASSGKVLDAISPVLPMLVGGSADLTGSNQTRAKNQETLSADNYAGTYVHYGVREHGMGAMLNGMYLHGGIRPYGGTFLVFSDYMRGAVRLSALMGIPVIYVFSHDSIGLGEDGPTHQPIEHLAALRAIPNLNVYRPADANETAIGWQVALEREDGPTALILTRQGVPTIGQEASDAAKGGYVIADSDNPQALILATGSEVEIALAAKAKLDEEGIAARVVSLPCWELFEQQSAEYRASIIPPHITARVSIEAASPFGWERYTGSYGTIIGIDRYGASAPYQTVYEKLGITSEAVVDAVSKLLS
jgi:transketolase